MATKSTGQTPAMTPMQVLQAMMEETAKPEEMILVIKGQELTIRYRKLTWLEKSEVLSLALEYKAVDGADGPELQAKLRHDVFRREVLKRIIIDAPIPLTSDKVLDNLPDDVGQQLERIIPSPFGSEQVAATKKG